MKKLIFSIAILISLSSFSGGGSSITKSVSLITYRPESQEMIVEITYNLVSDSLTTKWYENKRFLLTDSVSLRNAIDCGGDVAKIANILTQ